MIIVKIHGGLGNQLFQYAFARNLSQICKCDFKLDLRFFEENKLRTYCLNNFNIIESIAPHEEIQPFIKPPSAKLKRLKRKLFGSEYTIVKEKGPAFDQAYLKPVPHVYLDGYWQSEKYFATIAGQISREFEIKTAPSLANQAIIDILQQTNAVSVHIRRGDYEQDAVINKVHGTCPLSYYDAAAKLMAGKISDPVFYVFSDDIHWAKQNLNLTHPTFFVDINDGQSAYEDLRLMSHCKHHLLANSTFSWWGAWLNPHPDKIVIAPKNWFNDPELNRHAATLIPEKWIRI